MAGGLAEQQFEAAAREFPRMSEKGIRVTHAILVKGWTLGDVEREFQTSKQLAFRQASDVFNRVRLGGWVTEVVTLPPQMMEKVRAMVQEAREQWAQGMAVQEATPRADANG